MLRRIGWVGLVALSSSMMGGSLQASMTLTYTLSGVTIDANTSNPGLVVNTAVIPSLPSVVATLNNGQSQTFNLFNIWTNESSVNSDDTTAHPISVTLNFSTPPPTGSSGTVGGSTDGVSVLFGFYQYGQVTWNGSTTVSSGGDVYTISLSNATFNAGFFGLDPGPSDGATITATITQIASAPEPNTMISGILGVTFAGGGWYLRRRKMAA